MRELMTPTSLLDRAAEARAADTAVHDGVRSWTYEQLHDRAARVAGALAGITRGALTAVLAATSHVMLEMHFAAPWALSPLVALNTRLADQELEYTVGHIGSRARLRVRVLRGPRAPGPLDSRAPDEPGQRGRRPVSGTRRDRSAPPRPS
jgi:acyl-CoA synthetase (AMP-forming)/AMP-acid ligase II